MSNFTEQQIDEVWEKGRTIPGMDRDVYRKDAAGAIIKKTDRRVNSQYGWEIDHLKPLSLGGTEDSSNYLPLQWQNNVRKGDDYPRWATAVSADGQNNIELEKYWKVND